MPFNIRSHKVKIQLVARSHGCQRAGAADALCSQEPRGTRLLSAQSKGALCIHPGDEGAQENTKKARVVSVGACLLCSVRDSAGVAAVEGCLPHWTAHKTPGVSPAISSKGCLISSSQRTQLPRASLYRKLSGNHISRSPREQHVGDTSTSLFI